MVQVAPGDRPAVWDAQWPQETTEIAYQEAKLVERASSEWSDAIDRKVVTVFAVSAAIVTFVPTFQRPGAALWPMLAWLASIACFLLASYFCYQAYIPRPYLIGPEPRTIRSKEWLALPPGKYRFWMLEFMGQAVADNQAQANLKAEALGKAIAWTAAEVSALAIALVLTAAT